MRVVARHAVHGRVAEQVDARVAHVHPVAGIVLHETDGAGRARALVDLELAGDADDGLVCGTHGQVEEALRVENGLRRAFEHGFHGLERGLGGDGAIQVTPHAVEHHEQRRVLADGNGNTVLVVLTVARQAELGIFDLHALRPLSTRFCALSCHPVARYHFRPGRPPRPPALPTTAARTERGRRSAGGKDNAGGGAPTMT